MTSDDDDVTWTTLYYILLLLRSVVFKTLLKGIKNQINQSIDYTSSRTLLLLVKSGFFCFFPPLPLPLVTTVLTGEKKSEMR